MSDQQDLNPEDLLKKVREETAERRRGVAESAPAPIEVPSLEPSPADLPRISEGSAALAPRDAYTLEELLAFHDEDFVRNAYRALLRREPDEPGLAHHLSAIREGRLGKVEALGSLSSSPEGRRAGIAVRGLRSALWVRRSRRIPILGPLIQVALYVFRLPRIVANLERQEIQLLWRDRQLRMALNALARASEESSEARGQATAAAVRSLGDAVQRLNQEKAPRSVGISIAGRMAALHSQVASLATELAGSSHHAFVRRLDALESSYAALQNVRIELDRLAARIAPAEGEDGLELDDFYVEFEDQFRGDPKEIRRRVAIYAPIIEGAGAGLASAPVLDVGCGRGEWLSLLQEANLVARGVDLNRSMVLHCRSLGLDAVEADAVEYLRGLEAQSLGAVTALHVVEHLPFRRRIALIDAMLRALRPGGVAILETPNPENLIVGACSFWNDPTHVAPIPPEPMRLTVQMRGFAKAEIMRLHPFPASRHLPGGGEARDHVNHLIYGPQDYAIVATK